MGRQSGRYRTICKLRDMVTGCQIEKMSDTMVDYLTRSSTVSMYNQIDVQIQKERIRQRGQTLDSEAEMKIEPKCETMTVTRRCQRVRDSRRQCRH